MPLIRRALPADIERCLALAPPPAAAPTRLADDVGNADRLLLVAGASGRVVGYGRTARFRPAADAPADSVPAGYYLVGLAVGPSSRRQGIGSALTAPGWRGSPRARATPGISQTQGTPPRSPSTPGSGFAR